MKYRLRTLLQHKLNLLLLLTAFLCISDGMWGGTYTTVYYAVTTTYTVKCNTNHKGDGDDWHNYAMTKTSNTYSGVPVYSVSFTDTYNGLGKLQFQLYDGDTWKSEVVAISSWTGVSTYNGKLFYSGSWHTYTPCVAPSTYTVGGGGSICPSVESAKITLSGSESGYTYELYLDGSATGTTLSGSGSSLSFTGVTDAGTYTVYGYMSGCTPVQMSGSVTVSSKGVTISSIDPDPSSETIHEYEPVTFTASGSATWSINTVPTGITNGTDAYLSTTSGASTIFKGAKGTSGSYKVRATANGCDTDTTFSVAEWDDDCN